MCIVASVGENNVYQLTHESVVDTGSIIVLTSDAARTTRRASQTILVMSLSTVAYDSHRSMTL